MTSHRGVLPVLGAVVISFLAVLGSATDAVAAPPDPTTPLHLPAGVTATVSGSGAVSSEPFNDFPSEGDSYYVLSTGAAGSVFPASPDPDAQLSTDRGDDGVSDSSTLTLTVDDTTSAGCLFVDFALGTEEPVHTYTYSVDKPGDSLSIQRDGIPTEYAMNAGWGYFSQATKPAAPMPYTANAVDYWHHPGDPQDPIPGTAEEPWLAEATALNNVTTRDTARVPLEFFGGADEVITIKVSDFANGDLDSVALLDDVRLGSTCGAGTGVEPNPVHQGGVIAGIRGVGNALVYDPIPTTDSVERYDSPGNGWRSPSGVPVELRFRWYRAFEGNSFVGNMAAWEPIPDADRQAYVPTAVDYGKVLICLVTGVVDGRRYETFPSTGESGTWYVTTKIAYGTFAEGEAPTITGVSGRPPLVGDTLSAQVGHTVPREDSWGWRWYANGSRISGATAQTLTLSAAQAGKTITVEATAKRINFADRPFLSEPFGPIGLQEWSDTDIPTVVADGVPEYGDTLTADPGTDWSPTPDRYSYQWKRNGSVVSGATYADYTVRAEDVGSSMTVVVTGVKPGFKADPQESPAVTILGATMPGATPIVTGTPQVGQKLTGTVTDWDPTGSTLTFAWYVGGTLASEGSANFVVPATAIGKTVVLKVTGRRSGYTSRTIESAPTAAVVPGVLTSARPTIRGLAKVGQTLVASPGYWGPTGVKLAYRWKIGTNLVTGPKGGQQTFVIPRTARGKRISVVLTGTLAGYTTVKKTSAPTAKVTR